MPRHIRISRLTVAATGITVLAIAVATGGCRKLLGGGERTSLDDIEANLELLIPATKAGLDLQVSPRFLTFGPMPSATPWESPVPAGKDFEAHGQHFSFKTGRDGLIRERYEARPCPLREIWSCVELWATGRFGKDDQIACVGLRLEKGAAIEKRKLEMRRADNCPFMTTSAGPAQQVVRGVEKAFLDHAQQQHQHQEKDLDPKAP